MILFGIGGSGQRFGTWLADREHIECPTVLSNDSIRIEELLSIPIYREFSFALLYVEGRLPVGDIDRISSIMEALHRLA